METLLDALTLYAAENLIPRFQRETAAQTRTAWHKVDRLQCFSGLPGGKDRHAVGGRGRPYI